LLNTENGSERVMLAFPRALERAPIECGSFPAKQAKAKKWDRQNNIGIYFFIDKVNIKYNDLL
jgi:hypothetical protein